MKNLLTVCLLSLSTYSFAQFSFPSSAWQCESHDTVTTIIFAGRYFVETSYDLKHKQFISTCGGVWSSQNGHLDGKYEFNSAHPEMVGAGASYYVDFEKDIQKLRVYPKEKPSNQKLFAKIDDGKPGQLQGAWVITGRMQNGEMNSITPGDRLTMKILSGTRFQWIAYNKKTAEFFGTGGGTYTTQNGKYTENIEFFSRDNSRVGTSLQFDFSLEDEKWRHKGMSSKGEPIDEIWSKRGI